MKIQILSDLHFEFEIPAPGVSTYVQNAQRHGMAEAANQADVVVLAGDTHTKGRGPKIVQELFPDKPVVMICGNHEYYGQTYPHHLFKLQEQAKEIPGLHFLENEAVAIGDVVFLGATLWTDCKLWESGPQARLFNYRQVILDLDAGMNDYRRITYFDGRQHRILRPADMILEHNRSVKWLREQFEIYKGRKIVVVTHHAPSFRSIPNEYKKNVISAAFASNLDELVESSGALLWIHGHTHQGADYRIGETRVLANPRGYPEEKTWFRPTLTMEI